MSQPAPDTILFCSFERLAFDHMRSSIPMNIKHDKVMSLEE
ncbi:hypothetical protein [Candidatus Methanomassiliicoccus intestinalis]|nr:hypothetical protein [Candidatus Methanomassiliicoccus intestinalis]